MSEYPTATPFTTGDRDDIINRYNTHGQWMIDDDGTENNAIPKTFTDKTKWIDWKVTLIIFLNSQPRSNGVPINHVVYNNVKPIVRNNPNFLYDYANITPLQGRVFVHDAAK